MDPVEKLARSMFDAYNGEGPNPWKTFDGRDVPRWEQLNDQVRGKWLAAARKSYEDLGVPVPLAPELPTGSTFTCGRRRDDGLTSEVFRMGGENKDFWRSSGTCSYCGSMKPESVFEKIDAGEELTPTDKNYKLYVGAAHQKFYFQHFDETQCRAFIELLNAKKLKLGYPGHFYVRPFFFAPPKS